MKRKTQQLQIIRSNGEIDSVNADERKVTVSFSSETPTGSYYKEILSHNKGAVDLSVLSSGASVLYNHDPNQVIGKIVRAKVENRRGVADIVFDDDPFSENIYRKVTISKSIKGVSVGAMPDADSIVYIEKDQKIKLGDNQIKGPATIYKKWQPREISITPIPADNSVGVNRKDEPMDINEIVAGLFENQKFTDALNKSIQGAVDEIKKSLEPKKPDDKSVDDDKKNQESLLKRAETVSPICKGVVAEMILTGKTENEISDYIVKSAMDERQDNTQNKRNKADIDDNFILSGIKM